MNPLDMMIVAATIFFIVRGLFRGFFKEIGSLAGVILGIWLGGVFQPQMTDYLKEHLPWPSILPLISFALIFLFVLIVCNAAGWSLSVVLKKGFLGWADRAMGACLAIFKSVILTYLVIVLLTFFVPDKTPLIARSNLAPLVIQSYQSMVSLISPGSYQKWKRKFSAHLKQTDKSNSQESDR